MKAIPPVLVDQLLASFYTQQAKQHLREQQAAQKGYTPPTPLIPQASPEVVDTKITAPKSQPSVLVHTPRPAAPTTYTHDVLDGKKCRRRGMFNERDMAEHYLQAILDRSDIAYKAAMRDGYEILKSDKR